MIPSLVTLLIFNFKIDKVTLDLLIRPSTRGSNDVNNVITAVASRTRATAEAFVEKTWREAKENSGDEMVDSKPEDIKCMTYDEMYKSPDVDVIYSNSALFYSVIIVLTHALKSWNS